MKYLFFLLIVCSLIGCNDKKQVSPLATADAKQSEVSVAPVNEPSLIVLGTAQDAGAPQLGCQKDCCVSRFKIPNPLDAVVALGFIDPKSGNNYLFEATPDIGKQLRWLQIANPKRPVFPSGIFLTHGHIGHYSGLQFLGKESAATTDVSTYAMPKMTEFLSTNGPWDALVSNKNIALKQLDTATINLSENLKVKPLLVPHRDEYSETVGYHITGPNKSALFIPDIDKWNLWERSITNWVKKVDYAFLDATFFSGDELGGRDMSQIPHPSVEESMALFNNLSAADKKKVYFIHFNHTNPLLDPNSAATQKVLKQGYNIAEALQVFPM